MQQKIICFYVYRQHMSDIRGLRAVTLMKYNNKFVIVRANQLKIFGLH